MLMRRISPVWAAVGFVVAVGIVVGPTVYTTLTKTGASQNEKHDDLCQLWAKTDGMQALREVREAAPEDQETVELKAPHGKCEFPRLVGE